MKVTILPYMGPPAIVAQKVSRLTTSEAGDYEEEIRSRPAEQLDPALIFERKVERLSKMLGCSERDAERVIFERM